jgi:hypothetical protein
LSDQTHGSRRSPTPDHGFFATGDFDSSAEWSRFFCDPESPLKLLFFMLFMPGAARYFLGRFLSASPGVAAAIGGLGNSTPSLSFPL